MWYSFSNGSIYIVIMFVIVFFWKFDYNLWCIGFCGILRKCGDFDFVEFFF